MSQRSVCLLPVLLSTLLLALSGCAVDRSADLLNVIDVTPRDIEVGDTVEVLGQGLPSGNIQHGTVTFKGELRRPGQDPETKTITVELAKPSPDKVSFVFSEGLQAEFCGKGEHAAHTTFKGDVTVTLPPATPKGHKIHGKVMGITLDIRPPAARRVVLEARVEESRRALGVLGLELEEEAPTSGGLKVKKVKAESPAGKAGVQDGDLLVSFNGVSVNGITDISPRRGEQFADLGIKRGPKEVFNTKVSTAGFEPNGIGGEILAALLILGAAVLILLVFMAPTAGIITWVERRVSGRMQSRIGPNRAGPQGFFQWVADGVKSILKEDIIPTDCDQPLFRLAPYLVFVGVSATFVVMPFGQYLIAADLDIGILFIIAVTSLVAIGLLTGGWASNNKWSLLGGIRAAAQVISYEIPAAVAIVCIVMMTGSLSLQDIIIAQGGPAAGCDGVTECLSAGGWPWYWYVFRNPITFALFFLYFTTALAEGNRTPFDMPEAESELVAGYSTEYSGMRYVFFFFAEWANIFVFCGIASALFLGGWQLPGISPAQQEASIGWQLLGTCLFLLKSWILIFVVIWIRWTLPRVRIDQLMNLCWKWLVPLSFAAFMLTGLWVLATDPTPLVTIPGALPDAGEAWLPASAQLGIALATLALWILLLVHFFRRVRYNLKESKVPVHLNPFL